MTSACVVAAITLLAGSAEVRCLPEQPAVALASLAGLGPGPSGLMVAVWPDGRVLRADASAELGREYLLDRLTTSQMDALARFIAASGLSGWKEPGVPIDFPELRVALCQDGRRVMWSDVPGAHPESPLEQVARYLTALELPRPMPGRAPGLWIRWFSRAASR